MAKIHDYGVRLYPKLEEKTGQYVSWHGCGGIRFALKPAEVEWFHHVASVGKPIGFHCEIIDPEKIRQINPFVNVEGVLAGAWTTGDGHVDPAGCCNALAKGARAMGATIVRRTRVTDVKQRASGEWEVVTDQGNVVCEMVVNVAGVRQAKGCVYTEANGWERPKWFSPDGREEEVGFRHNNVSEVVGEECRRHQRLGGAGARGAALARGAREAHRCRARQRTLPLADRPGDPASSSTISPQILRRQGRVVSGTQARAGRHGLTGAQVLSPAQASGRPPAPPSPDPLTPSPAVCLHATFAT